MLKMFLAVCAVAGLTGVVLAEEAKDAITHTFYGQVQYRFREVINLKTPISGPATYSLDYKNMFGAHIGDKIKINDRVSAQFQIGNMSYNTEAISWSFNGSVYNLINLAFAKYDAGAFSVTLGKMPVVSSGPLDLIERSIAYSSDASGNRKYDEAANVSWAVGTNGGGLLGLKLGAPVLTGDVALDVEVLTSIITARSMTMGADTNAKGNPSSVMIVANVPVFLKDPAITIAPQLVAILFRNHNSFSQKSDHEIGVGLAASYKLNSMVSLGALFGYAGISNSETRMSPSSVSEVTATSAPEYAYSGIIAGFNMSIKAGPGTFSADIKGSTAEDAKIVDSRCYYLYGDFKYDWACYKNFSVAPRLRFFDTEYSKISTAGLSKTEIRPELIASIKF